MNEFNEVKKIFENKRKFEEITRSLMNKEIREKGELILKELDCKLYLNSRDLLSCFLINKFPKDTVGDINIETNKNLIELVQKLLKNEYLDNDELKIDVVKYSYYFKTWKNEDIEILKNQLFNEYHQLTVDIVNLKEDEEDKKVIYEETQKKILECAFQIGGDDFINQIQSHSPVLIDVKELENQYNKAYNDVFVSEFEEKNYEKLSGLMEFLKNIFKTLRPKDSYEIEKIIDIPYILHKLNFNQFNEKKKLELFNFILDFMEKVQSKANDDELNSIRNELKVKEICFPKIFIKIMDLLKKLIYDFEIIQQGLKKN